MSTVSHKNVALVRAGTWSASTGVTKITAEDLASMAEAYADKVVDRPVIKIGHDNDNTFNAALGDGEPAYGWLGNVGVGDGSAERPDADTLYGDYVGMPAKLAEVAPAAFRRRSVEIAWQARTAAGKAYRAVLTGIALLGISKPAVKGLDDVLALYSDDTTTAEAFTQVEVVDGLTEREASLLSAARESVIALAGNAGLPPAGVVAALERLDKFAGLHDTGLVPPPIAEPANGEPASTTTTTSTTQEGTRMPIKKSDVDEALKAAGDEDVTARLQALLGAPAKEAETGAGAAGAPAGAPAAPAAPAALSGAPVIPEGTVLVTQDMWADVQAKLSAAGQVTEQVAADRRDKIVATALSEGRITVPEQKVWREKLDENEALTTSLLTALAPRFTTTAQPGVGFGVGPDAGGSELSADEKAGWADFDASLGLAPSTGA